MRDRWSPTARVSRRWPRPYSGCYHAKVFAPLTGTENPEVVKRVRDRKTRIAELFALFPALIKGLKARTGSLSGGERQQFAFARALMTRPRLVVLDEQRAALSPPLVEDSFRHIAELAGEGTAVLFIEQRARQALAISDVGYILDIGKVALKGPARTLLDDDRTASLYLDLAY